MSAYERPRDEHANPAKPLPAKGIIPQSTSSAEYVIICITPASFCLEPIDRNFHLYALVII
ncbi:MAG: hypothetical protein WAM42_08310, partial [Candidatus Nitrosopolaris sp.]